MMSDTVKESLYTSEKYGDDLNGDGSESKPFKTVLQAMKTVEKEPLPREYHNF